MLERFLCDMAPVFCLAGFVMILCGVAAMAERRAESRRREAMRAYREGLAVAADDVRPELRAEAPRSYGCNLIEHAGRHETAAGANFCMYSRHLLGDEGVTA